MSKRLIFSDLHLHPVMHGAYITQDGYNSRLWAQWLACQEMINDAVNEGVKYAYFCGDLFDRHGQIPTQALMIASELFNELRRQGIKIRAIPGNHDQYDRRGAIHALGFLPESERIGHWVDEGLDVRSLPYTTDDDVLERFLGEAGDGGGSMLLLHQGVSGIPLSSGHVLDERLTHDMIPDNCRAFTGHYHFYKPVTPRLTVVGNLTPLGWGDIDQSKGWLIWDDETGSLEQRLQTACPHYITWSEGIAKHSDMENLNGDFVRYTDAVLHAEQDDIRKSIIKEGALSVDFPTMKIDDADDHIRGGEGVTIEHLTEQFDKRTEGRRVDVGREVREANYEVPGS